MIWAEIEIEELLAPAIGMDEIMQGECKVKREQKEWGTELGKPNIQ